MGQEYAITQAESAGQMMLFVGSCRLLAIGGGPECAPAGDLYGALRFGKPRQAQCHRVRIATA